VAVQADGATAGTVDAVRRTPGVAAVAAVADGGEVVLRAGRAGDALAVHVVDLAALRAVQDGLPGVDPVPVAPRGSDDSVAVVLVGDVEDDLDDEPVLDAGGSSAAVPVTVLATRATVPGATGPSAVLVDDASAQRLGLRPVVERLLVRTAPGADPAAVAADVAAVVADATG
ncbi:hypothetical protein, partial [Cellulomonas algicola]